MAASLLQPACLSQGWQRLTGNLWVRLSLLYLLAALLVTYPAVLHLTDRVAGDDSTSSDTRESVWGIWWWKHALLDLHQSPLQISVLNQPQGDYFPLYPLMAQAYLLALPVAVLTTPVLAYNVVFLLALVLSGLCGYRLCTEISGDRRAGFVGGLIWAFFPAKMAQALAGHFALIMLPVFPLAAWRLIRMLKTPTTRNAVYAALALTAAATVHPIYLAYVVAPAVLVLVVHAALSERQTFWRRNTLGALALALGLAGGGLALLLAPALRQMSAGTPLWSASGDVLGFSPDLLAYFVPSVDNPLIRGSALANLALRVEPYQYSHLIYLGWLPLGLAVLGAAAAPQKSRPWVWLAAGGAVLALGPLLKFGGVDVRVPIAGQSYRIVLPYALLVNLPFFQWSRTPGRLTVLVMLALAVLASVGLRRLLQAAGRGLYAAFIVGELSVLILVEYQARFPFPTFSADVPEPVKMLRATAPDQTVLQVPINLYQDNERALYWQTVHQHPLVGGRVYRDVAEVAETYAFYRQWLLAPLPAPGQAVPTLEQRLGALASAHLGWVLYDAQADTPGTLRAQLQAQLGPPVSEDNLAALFRLPAEPTPRDLLWGLDGGWGTSAEANAPQSFCQQGLVYLFVAASRTGQLHFMAQPGPDTAHFSVRVGGQIVGRFTAGETAQFATEVLTLSQGFNRIEFVDEEHPADGAGSATLPCQAQDHPVPWGPAISALQFDEAAAGPVATFGQALQLIAVTVPDHAQAGQSLSVHLAWQAAAAPLDNLTIFVHLDAPNGELMAQQDAPPLGGQYPTSQWALGERVAYSIPLALPANLPAGQYQWRLGVYSSVSQERLPVSGAEAADNALAIGTLTIAPP